MLLLGQGGAVIKFVNTSGRPELGKSSFETEKGKDGAKSTMREYQFALFITYDYGDKYKDD
jgi:hypothetical protein